MKTLLFYCSDTETLEILNKYSDEGLLERLKEDMVW